MPDIEFTVPGLPIAQPRAHPHVINGHAVMFQAKKKHGIHAFKAACQIACAAVHKGAPMEGPISLTVLFVFPRPGRLKWKTRPMPRQYHQQKPDCDNLVKGLKDALKSLAWVDDGQVSVERLEKVYGAADEQPRVEVSIQRLS